MIACERCSETSLSTLWSLHSDTLEFLARQYRRRLLVGGDRAVDGGVVLTEVRDDHAGPRLPESPRGRELCAYIGSGGNLFWGDEA